MEELTKAEYGSLVDTIRGTDVMFSYCGSINRRLLTELLKATRNRLIYFKENQKITNRVYNAINETAENFIIHGEEAHINAAESKLLLVITANDTGYSIITGNLINEIQKNGLESKLQYLLGLSFDEKKLLFSGTLKNSIFSERDTAGLGLIDIAIKADNMEYAFQPKDGKFFYILNIRINR